MASAGTELGREVSIFGTDASGKPFFETVHAIKFDGADVAVQGLQRTLRVKDIVGLRHGGEKGRFEVTWVGSENTPEQGQLRLRNLEPFKNIFAPVIQAQPFLTVKPSLEQHERRRQPRIACRGTVTFRREGTTAQDSGILQDLSEGGCYIETVSTAPALSHVDLTVNAPGLQLRAVGEVQASHPGMGMGIAFADMASAYRARLHEWVTQHSRLAR